MQYFYRAHCPPETVLEEARRFFAAAGLRGDAAQGDRAHFADVRGSVEITVEIEGGHYTRVTAQTGAVGESEIDRVAKRFLSELHAIEEPGHRVRGAY